MDKEFNVVISPEIAEKLRSKKVAAFIPVSAADLVWLEASSIKDENDLDNECDVVIQNART